MAQLADSPAPAQLGAVLDARQRVLVLSVLAIAQAVLVGLTGHGPTRVLAILLALAGLNARLAALSVLAGFIVINFSVHVAGLPVPIHYRLPHVAIFAAYGAVAFASAVAAMSRIRFTTAFAVFGVLAAGFVAAEGMLANVLPPAIVADARVTWDGDPDPDAVFGGIYAPYGVFRTRYPGNTRNYFDTDPAGAPSSARAPYSLTYSLNALGCRGRDYTISNAHQGERILVLGGSSAFGVGVREADTFAARLESLLNDSAGASGSGQYEVINCGISGTGTGQQRRFFEQVADRYQPDVVVLAMNDRDNLSSRDEVERGFVHRRGRLEQLFVSARLWQWGRHEGRRSFDYSATADDVVALSDACRLRGARLAVVFFRNADVNRHWTDLEASVSAALKGRSDVPVQDLGLALLKQHPASDLVVDPLDPNPNEVAHRLAAEELERMLQRERLIAMRSGTDR